MWQRVRSLIVKELLAILRDPRGRYILIVPPMVQLLVFSVAATQEVKNVHMAVLNEDYGTAARDLVARFEGSTHFSEIRYLRGEADIAPAIDSRGVLMVLHLGPDFSRRLEGGMPAEVQLILDGRRSNAAQIVAGYAQAIFDAFDRELALARRAPPPPSVVAARVWFNPNLETTWNTVPGPGGDPHDPDGAGGHGALRGPRARARHVRAAPRLAAESASRSSSARRCPP